MIVSRLVLGFLRTIPEITMLISMTKFFFNNSFEVVIPDCPEWVGEGPCFDDNSILWFTDGSKKDSRVVQIWRSEVQISASLRLLVRILVFQSEVHNIELCARKTCPGSSFRLL